MSRFQLPPISTFSKQGNFETMPLPVPTDEEIKMVQYQMHQIRQNDGYEQYNNINSIEYPIQQPQLKDERLYHAQTMNINYNGLNPITNMNEISGQYKLADDMQILKAIKAYYGNSFSGNVPWSFWQTYIKTTGCNRSSSSLYHHWNGSMQRKYGSYLKQKRIDECIQWIENEMKSSNPSKRKCMKEDDDSLQGFQPTGQPMCHNWSAPPSFFSQANNNNNAENGGSNAFPVGAIGDLKMQLPRFY